MKVFGIVGWKSSGKTDLVVRLVQYFAARELRVATMKRAHCGFDIDREGTDSYKHRAAGAKEVLVSSKRRWALMHELGDEGEELPFAELLNKLSGVDLVMVEGFKSESHPKLQVVRPAISVEPLPPGITNLVAIASDEAINPKDYGCDCPLLALDNTEEIAQFVLERAEELKPEDI